jgi:uncharacterized protein
VEGAALGQAPAYLFRCTKIYRHRLDFRVHKFMRIVWDEAKRLTNLAKHGLDFADLDPNFFSEAALGPTDNGRFVAIGEWAGVAITVVFRPLGAEAISVISMRSASRKERGR